MEGVRHIMKLKRKHLLENILIFRSSNLKWKEIKEKIHSQGIKEKSVYKCEKMHDRDHVHAVIDRYLFETNNLDDLANEQDQYLDHWPSQHHMQPEFIYKLDTSQPNLLGISLRITSGTGLELPISTLYMEDDKERKLMIYTLIRNNETCRKISIGLHHDMLKLCLQEFPLFSKNCEETSESYIMSRIL